MFRKRLVILGLAALACTASILVTQTFVNANAAAGTAADPLVTRSYVDERIEQLIGSISANMADMQRTIQQEHVPSPHAPPPLFVPSTQIFAPVHIATGQIIIGHEGAEMILRSGQVLVHSTGIGGLVDVTIGAELYHSSSVSANHLLIVPRHDGRGLRAVADSWVLIKGEYDLF